jgi:hypothetical protein
MTGAPVACTSEQNVLGEGVLWDARAQIHIDGGAYQALL